GVATDEQKLATWELISETGIVAGCLYFTIASLGWEICRRRSEFRPKTAAQCQISKAVHVLGTVAGVGKIVEPELLLVRIVEAEDFACHPVARIEFVAVGGVEQYALQTTDKLRPEEPGY